MSLPTPKTAAAKIKNLSRLRPTLALVLGSGFNHVLSALDGDARVTYAKLPGFPKPSVAGHVGELVIGKLGGTPVLVLSGRAHFYEGHPMERVAFAVRALAAYGIRDLLLTNAAGGINRKFLAGLGKNPRAVLVGQWRVGLVFERAHRLAVVAIAHPAFKRDACTRAFIRQGALQGDRIERGG